MCRRCLLLLFVLLPGGCAVTGGWQQANKEDVVELYYREHPGSSIPEFRAAVEIDASRSAVMSVLTDFTAWPEWLYRCERAEIISTRGYQEAWIYQVTALPVVRDRDVIMHAVIRTNNVGDDDILITAEAAPDYCSDSERSICREVNRSNHVLVTALSGRFRLSSLENGNTKVIWEQYLDPGGMIPDWITRLMLDDVPMRSLERLKQIVEQEG